MRVKVIVEAAADNADIDFQQAVACRIGFLDKPELHFPHPFERDVERGKEVLIEHQVRPRCLVTLVGARQNAGGFPREFEGEGRIVVTGADPRMLAIPAADIAGSPDVKMTAAF